MRDAKPSSWEAAQAFEDSLSRARRKKLGQFFTGRRLSRLLAALAVTPDTRTVLDPMAGNGDLLAAVSEASTAGQLDRLHGMEIDRHVAEYCHARLHKLAHSRRTEIEVANGDAFDPALWQPRQLGSYDLVITNPPYVRYQTIAIASDIPVRSRLEAILENIAAERDLWLTLARSYSGLADLSVPAWLLAGAMVRPGGRLALVAPATWRTREYANLVRYFVLRLFQVEFVVEDTQPGWFSNALVRTHLIVARRLPIASASVPLEHRADLPPSKWLTIGPRAASDNSLVGAAFVSRSEEAFAEWAAKSAAKKARGIELRLFDNRSEWAAVRNKLERRSWFKAIEPIKSPVRSLLPAAAIRPKEVNLPDEIGALVNGRSIEAETLDETGIEVGQGLRTGCNDFFYADWQSNRSEGQATIRTSPAVGGKTFDVPQSVLRSVIRRQSDLPAIERGEIPKGRVLDLRQWVLPEDRRHYSGSAQAMPPKLALYVRNAAETEIRGKLLPELSAVRPNIRPVRGKATFSRFWYMLPDFAPRHLPAAFVPRIVHDEPWTEQNFGDPLLVDANFSTFWSQRAEWTPAAMKAVFNSAWCHLYMEAIGTRLGGGALKLEAAHLRQILIPRFSREQLGKLDALGRQLTRGDRKTRRKIDDIVFGALLVHSSRPELDRLASAFCEARSRLQLWRLRTSRNESHAS